VGGETGAIGAARSIGIARRIETTTYTGTERKRESAGRNEPGGPQRNSSRIGMQVLNINKLGSTLKSLSKKQLRQIKKRESIPRRVLSSMCRRMPSLERLLLIIILAIT
jgi:hypothetical protein